MSIQGIHENTSNSVYQSVDGAGKAARPQPEGMGEKAKDRIESKDEYIHDDLLVSLVEGIYSEERDSDGNIRINYVEPRTSHAKGTSSDSPVNSDSTEDSSAEKAAPVKATEKGESTSTINTDRVDGEIKRLKQQRQMIQRQLSAEYDEVKRAELQSRLQQIDSQLSQKDNDMYRRQNAEKA